MALIEDKKLDKFVHSKINNSFDLSVDDVAKNVTNCGRFSAWLDGNVSEIKKVLNAVKDEGVSPAFFGAYECGEGYNASWGWLNHTTPQGDPVQDARSVAKWIVSQSKSNTDNPAWIDYANYNDFVPNNVKSEGNADFQKMPSGAIGKVVIAGTAAATWEVYYPNGLKASYNGVQDYGKPLTEMYQNIESWGGSLDGDSDGGDDGDNGNGGDDGDDGDDGDGGLGDIDWGDLFPNDPVGAVKKVINGVIDKLEEYTNWDMHSIGNDKFFSNNYFNITKTFDNTYRLKLNVNVFDELKDMINPPKDDNDGGDDGGNDGDGGDDGGDDGDDGDDNKSNYNTCDLKEHTLNFRYAKTADDFPPGYPFPDANGHHGNDYGYVNEVLKSHVSGTVDGNNNHGWTVGDKGIGYDGDGMGWGNRIVIKLDDGSGRSVLYAHLSKISVSAGGKIKVGQTIGVTGNTGEMTNGAHLHFELKDAKNSDAADDGTIDPTNFVDKHCNK